MTPIEIIALIMIIVAAIKIIVLLIKPSSWFSVIKAVYAKPTITMIVSLILAALVLNYLLAVGITIIEIFAVMAFLALITVIGIAAYFNEILQLAKKMLKDNHMVKKAWLAILVWAVLIVWALYVLFI